MACARLRVAATIAPEDDSRIIACTSSIEPIRFQPGVAARDGGVVEPQVGGHRPPDPGPWPPAKRRPNVAGPESANNAASQTSFIPMLTLGLPGNPVMALMIGALVIQGIRPERDSEGGLDYRLGDFGLGFDYAYRHFGVLGSRNVFSVSLGW